MPRSTLTIALSCLLCLAFAWTSAEAQTFALLPQSLTDPEGEPAPVHPVPHPRQMAWQETEFYAFFHYGMNTYTDKEWGFGDEDETLFQPTAAPCPKQWLRACRQAGMRGGIAVVKHHDGFCLWPTATTTHNVTRAGNAHGRRTNIPRDFAAAARDLGMKYGFYVSPWDRNSAHYGTDRYVRDVFLRQCAELAEYGSDQFEMWFDGANGGDGYYGGARDKRSIDESTYYDVPNLRDSVHTVCPDCVMWGLGGEARWIGNEEGWAGETNWSTLNRGMHADNYGMYGTEDGWMWLPGESDAKATDQGWFFHPTEMPLSAERLFQMYLETVGRNATLILNCPPDRSGRLPRATVRTLRQMGRLLRQRLRHDYAREATLWTVSDERRAGATRTYGAEHLRDGDATTYWATNDSVTTAVITLSWRKAIPARYVQLMEHIRLGQRIQSFTIETSRDAGQTWQQRAGGQTLTTVGYKRIVPLTGTTADSYAATPEPINALRLTITSAKACPTLSSLAVF